MRFNQLDGITELDPGQRIVATRTLRAEEDYLKDHFPHFPVMPGVMMLEACYQAAMWMVLVGDDFGHPLVVLKEARNVKFADFLAPGETLTITAEALKDDGDTVTAKVQAQKGDRVTVSARLILERQSVPSPPQFDASADVCRRRKAQFAALFPSLPSTTSN